MAVLKVSVDRLASLEQELSIIMNESRNLDMRLRAAVDTLASSWEGEEVSVLLKKIREIGQSEEEKAVLLDTLIQLIRQVRETYMQADANIASIFRN